MTSLFLPPIAAIRVPVPPRGAAYLHEVKFDGFRDVVCGVQGDTMVCSKRGYPPQQKTA
jgi:bifunctional non-homologous end joining protein LigD